MYQSKESEMEGGGSSSKMKINLSLKSLVVVHRAHSFREICLQRLYDCDTGPGPETREKCCCIGPQSSVFHLHLSLLRIFSSLKTIVTNKGKLLLKQYIGFDPFFDCSYFIFHSMLLELPHQSLAFDLIDCCQSLHKTDLK